MKKPNTLQGTHEAPNGWVSADATIVGVQIEIKWLIPPKNN